LTEQASEPSHPIDVDTIERLAALMSQHDLSEIRLAQGETRLLLKRGQVSAVAPVVVERPMASAPVAQQAPAPEQPAAAPKPDKKYLTIKSPTPGTFYVAATPGAEPFVRVGSKVNPTTVVGVIEAMKLFNEITADCTGVISEILVQNQQPVEYNQVLFKVDPAG